MIFVDMVDGRFDYFNIIPNMKPKDIEKERSGFYLGH
jgi:hypothetical protein